MTEAVEYLLNTRTKCSTSNAAPFKNDAKYAQTELRKVYMQYVAGRQPFFQFLC